MNLFRIANDSLLILDGFLSVSSNPFLTHLCLQETNGRCHFTEFLLAEVIVCEAVVCATAICQAVSRAITFVIDSVLRTIARATSSHT
jgi:hypothetical protein